MHAAYILPLLFLGCYEKSNSIKYQATPRDTADECVEECKRQYFKFAVYANNNNTNCSCTNLITTPKLPDERCDTTLCANNNCEGVEGYYDTTIEVPGPVSNLAIKGTPDDNSIAISWRAPPADGVPVESYEIIAKVIKSYSSYNIRSPPIWKVDKMANQFELLNLHPGTTYNITVTSIAQNIKGGEVFMEAETEIGIPDPEPDEPNILSRTSNKITIEIPTIINDNGPITSFQVVVQFVGDEFVQNFNNSLLKTYSESQEDGTPYYITAELDMLTKSFVVGDGQTYRGFYNAPLPPNAHVHISVGIISMKNGVTKIRYGVTSHEQHDALEVIPILIDPDDNSTIVIFLSTLCIIVGFLLLASVSVYFYIRFRTSANRRQRLSDQHELTIQHPSTTNVNNGYLVDNVDAAGPVNFNDSIKILIGRLTEEKQLIRKNLTLDIDNIIGNGKYGEVIYGNLKKNTQLESCQVHSTSDDMEKLEQISFLRELEDLIRLGDNKHTLHFYGICQTSDWMFLVFENIPVTLKKRLVTARNSNHFITETKVFQFMLDVCEAANFLSNNKIIVKTINSYNIRIDENDNLKISIFGPILFEENRKDIEPSRWYAPEVLKYNNYSDKSDVWSLGIVMWECCCLGATPYGNTANDNLLQRIKNGARPEQPPFIFDDLYQLFLNCWEIDACDRPTFAEVLEFLNQCSSSIEHMLSYRMNNIILPYYIPTLEIKS